MCLSGALIVDTASDLLLWSKGKHVLVSGVLNCTLELDIYDYLGVGRVIAGSVWPVIRVIVVKYWVLSCVLLLI